MKAVLHLMLAIATLIGAARSHAAPVTFWFAGTVNRAVDLNGGLLAGVGEGTPFNGRIRYEPELFDLTLTGHSTNVVNYYYRLPSGFSFWMQIGGHVVTNNAEFKTSQWSGNIGIINDIDGRDRYTLEIGNNGMVTDGLSDTNSYIDIRLSDYSGTAISSPAIPPQPPDLALFPDGQLFSWLSYDPVTQIGFEFDGVIDRISTVGIVTLNIRRNGPGTVQLAWPLAVSGGRLQSSTGLPGADWQDVQAPVVAAGMEYVVTVPAAGPQTWYRLKLP